LANSHFGFGDCSITSADGQYAFIFERLTTKGLLLKNGKLLREINRSYYCASVYEYPAAFITFDGNTYLAHCPFEYCRLDFEEVETGEIVTNIAGRNPSDVFHSRLIASPDGRHLMVRGWAWHPVDKIELFNIASCFASPLMLDNATLWPDIGREMNTASFIDNKRVLIASTDEEPFDDEEPNPFPPKSIAVWNVYTNEVSDAIKVNGEFGNLFAIDHTYAWDMYKYPKLINITTGEIVGKCEEINSGVQCSSIMHSGIKNFAQICFNRHTSKIAIKIDSQTIEVLTPA